MLNKIKKIIIGVGLFLYTLPSKMLAYSNSIVDIQPLYAPKQSQEDLIYESNMWKWKIFQLILLPIILLIGLVIYIKKSKSSKKRKIIISIITIVIIALIYIIHCWKHIII